MSLSNFFNGNNLVNEEDLSPVSVQRLNFDRLPTETTDPITPTKNVFGLPVPQFVPESIISWLDNNTSLDLVETPSNQFDITSNLSAAEKITFSAADFPIPIVRKVCESISLQVHFVLFCFALFVYFVI